MCGIAGKFNFALDNPIDREQLTAMTAVVSHRGPDADGFYIGGGIGLGFRRLSIIDLSTGDQPLANEDHTIWVIFNGEIYNFAEIRSELEAFGHCFRTRTDTEVIVHAYEQWGDRAVERFRGMFGFALWDEPRRRLLIVRDRLGIKPIYYSLTKSGVTFGSEIKSLLEDPDVPRAWSPEALDAYLALQYVPCPRTMYADVWKLPPGHLLVAENDRVSVRRYWDLTFTGDGDPSREADYLERLDALVSESVRLRLLADVPLGAFLSGGIDSSAVVAAMVEQCPSRVLTTSVGFDEAGFSELEYARTVATHLGTESFEKIVQPDIVDLLPKLAWHFDEPFADSSAVPTYYVSKAARERVTVALSGDGGDELWAGYARHRVEQWEGTARRWLGPVAGRMAGRIAGRVPLRVKGARSLRHLALSPAEACARKHAYGLFDGQTREAFYSRDFAASVRDADPFVGFRAAYEACSSSDPLDRALYVDVKTYLVDDILTKVDKMSMAVSLETRVPLLDHQLLEFAATVPTPLKLKNGQSKYLLRRLLEKRLPTSIIDRPKHGFEAPIGDWLSGPLAPMVDSLLLDGRFKERGIFDDRSVARLWREHRNGASDHRHRLWSLVMLELWFREYADGSGHGAHQRATAGVAA
ncbi:MAG TPA: asparagine synthase (glutamine-hydrolyzing) [Vicinamibacterales bacterium]|nr:asparagine synthase (glutamine-hydrolyzing) [Vicinamibacterales bacterium]